MARRSGGAAGRGRRHLAVVVVVVIVVSAVVVSVVAWAHSREPGASADDGAASAAGRTDPVDEVMAPATTGSSVTTTITVPSTTTSTAPVCDRRPELDARRVEPPAEWTGRVTTAVDDPAWGATERSISVWVEGYGEIVAWEPDRPLLPASNEKLLTALGVRALLDPAARFRTVVHLVGDHLVLVADGDPTLRTLGPHSLAALAQQVRAAGIGRVSGVLVDASRFEPATSARGWQDWQVPAYSGPLSALTVDDNRGRTDGAYLADPALGNTEAFARALRTAGVEVAGPVAHGAVDPTARVVAALESSTTGELVHDMLLTSDNETAEALVRRIGGGSTEVGVARITATLEPWCLHLDGEMADGSGLSRSDRRSAREWRHLLQVALERPWAAELWAGLPVAGRTGTLRDRLTGPTTNGTVMAKTGTIIGGAALSGYATTFDGRRVVFSIVVNGEPGAATQAVGAIDRLVTAIVSG